MSTKRYLGICCVLISALATVACDQAAEAPARPPAASPPTPTKTTARTTPSPTRPAIAPASVVVKASASPIEPVVNAAASRPPTTPLQGPDSSTQLKAAEAEVIKAQAAFQRVKEEVLKSLRASNDYQAAAKIAADLEVEVKKLRAADAPEVGDVSLKSLGAKSDLARMEKIALAKAKADPKYLAAEDELADRNAVVTNLRRQVAEREAALLAQRQAVEAAALVESRMDSTVTSPSAIEQPSRSNAPVRSSGSSVQCSGTTRKGNRCQRMTTSASGRCYQH